MTTAASTPESFHLVDPEDYARHGYPHDVWTRLRAEDPVHWWERGEGRPFWAITKRADIVTISTQPDKFLNAPRLTVSHIPEPEQPQNGIFPPTLIQMDPPRHRVFRKLLRHRFTPQALKKIDGDIVAIGKEIVDSLVEESDSGECDFVQKVAAPLPIAVIAWLLGVSGFFMIVLSQSASISEGFLHLVSTSTKILFCSSST